MSAAEPEEATEEEAGEPSPEEALAESAQLSGDQNKDLRQITAVVERQLAYLDYSPTGTGKTRVTCQLAKNYGLGLFVVCPKPAKSVWIRDSEVVGARLEVIMTLGQLAGKIHCRLGHPYLLRLGQSGEAPAGSSQGGTQYKVTPEFGELVEEGILLVLDEAHHGKNITTCIHAAFSALSQYIAGVGGVSRIGLLSATIIDKAGLQCMAAVELLGLAPLPMYVQHPGRPVELKGFRRLAEAATALDPRLMAKIKRRYLGRKWTATLVADEISRIFVQVVIPSLGSTMNPVMYKGIGRHYFYKYFDLDAEAQARYDEACENIDRAARDLVRHASYLLNPYREPPPMVKELFGVIASWLVHLDCLLVEPALRQARQWLEGSDCKVVLCLNVIRCSNPLHVVAEQTQGDHVEYFMEQLADYNPVRYTGEVSEQERLAAIDLFQEHNSKTRVMVATSGSLKESISLHDTSGTPPVAVQIVNGEEVEISANAGIFSGGCQSACAEGSVRAASSRERPPDVFVPGRFPRKAIVMPSYRMTEIHQIAGRFYRFGVSSNVELAIPLGKGKKELRSVLNSLASKSAILAMITHHAEMGVIFPGDYDVEIEGRPPLSEADQRRYRGDPSQLLRLFEE